MLDDLSSTLRYRRDSFLHFLVYFGRFLLGGYIELPLYLRRSGKKRIMRRMMVGEYSLVAVCIVVCWLAPAFGLFTLVLPAIIIRFMMMAGNWGQHAFINTARPNDGMSNAITCINSAYNRRCFNDGYHIGHHLKSTRHWTEMPGELLSNAATYDQQGAIVFAGLDFFGVWACLMVKRYDVLAKRFVRLGDLAPQGADIITLLQSRTQWSEHRGALSRRHATGD
jgi:hypothetical protein